MFKGTPSHGPKQFARLVEQNGGQDNAFTSQDVTSYYVDIAADKLDLVIDLEADRMQNLLLDPKADHLGARGRHRGAADPHRGRSERLPRRGGELHRLQGASLRRADHRLDGGHQADHARRRFAPSTKTYYVPNNAIVVAVGAFRAADALEKITPALRTDPARQGPAAGAGGRAAPERRAARDRQAAGRAADRLPGLARAEPAVRRRGGPRGALDDSVGRAGLAALSRSRLSARSWPSRPAATTRTSRSTPTCSGSGRRRCRARRPRSSRPS